MNMQLPDALGMIGTFRRGYCNGLKDAVFSELPSDESHIAKSHIYKKATTASPVQQND